MSNHFPKEEPISNSFDEDPARDLEEKSGLTEKISKLFKGIFDRFELFRKRLRNRIPEKYFVFFKNNIAPYAAAILIASFSIFCNVDKALGSYTEYVPSDDVMDLSPADVADVASGISNYVPLVQVDPVTLAIAMDPTDYLGKPLTAETQITQEPAPAVSTKRSTTITYTVDNGDTLSSIGWKYGLKIATIKALNGITSDNIRPGQKLKLPPQDLDPTQLAKLKTKKIAGASAVNYRPGSRSNAYPYGWCTYWVATRRYVPGGWGNAKSWLSSAARSGYKTGSQPVAGAIVVTSESWLGHVAFVESVSGDSVNISEMNYKGWGISSHRTISAHAGIVRGYIY